MAERFKVKRQRTVCPERAIQSFGIKSYLTNRDGLVETYLLSAELFDKSGSFSRLAR